MFDKEDPNFWAPLDALVQRSILVVILNFQCQVKAKNELDQLDPIVVTVVASI